MWKLLFAVNVDGIVMNFLRVLDLFYVDLNRTNFAFNASLNRLHIFG